MTGADMSNGDQQCVIATLSYHYNGQEEEVGLVGSGGNVFLIVVY